MEYDEPAPEEEVEVENSDVENLIRMKLSADKKADANPSETCENLDFKWPDSFHSYDDYSMCSHSTMNLAEIYTSYMSTGTYEERTKTMYPLLDRVVEWIHSEYGEESIP